MQSGNSLSLLIGSYNNSDSEDDNETTEATPSAQKMISSEWTECLDKSTGHPYYWNTKTKEVTWEIPDAYKSYLEIISKNRKYKSSDKSKYWTTCYDDNKQPYYVNKLTRVVAWEKPKEMVEPVAEKSRRASNKVKENKRENPFKARRPSEEEKIVLISSYSGSESSSDEESKSDLNKNNGKSKEPLKEETDSTKLNTRIFSIKNDLNSCLYIPRKEDLVKDETDLNIPIFASNLTEYKTDADLHKELFKDENEQKEPEVPIELPEPETSPLVDFDKKSFKRKRRIEFAVSGPKQKSEEELPPPVVPSQYSNFTKSEDLVGSNSNDSKSCFDVVDSRLEINELSDVIRSKMKFLSEGSGAVTSIQAMNIQFETLIAAYEAKGLLETYLLKWLHETDTSIIELEKDVAPDGWECKWDRTNSRYCYLNLITGDSRLEFPETETVEEDSSSSSSDEMDICTTPPPTVSDVVSVPEPPTWNVDDLVTPPPPMISDEPLPPGIDLGEYKTDKKNDSLGSELESFYSDLATLEETPAVPLPIQQPTVEIPNDKKPTSLKRELVKDPTKKKTKKIKVPGISSKMKDVSSMVAKWQKVQQDLNK